MSFAFDAARGLIIVRVELPGPTATAVLRLALDTGATRSLINSSLLIATGYDPASATDRVQVTTGSGVESAPLVIVRRLDALGLSRKDFPVLAHTLPPTAGVDGVLGLDFLRHHVLTIGFRDGQITLSAGPATA